jgi:ankyrin repeat protein/mono/diheme cytochrome c family protein
MKKQIPISKRNLVLVAFAVCGFASNAEPAKSPARIEFARDIQPLFKQHCLDCHGAEKQSGNFRLDRKREAFKGGTIAQIAPGSSDGSRLYHKLIGGDYGKQMPPDDPLKPEEIKIIKAWLDEGAVWPDEFSGDPPIVPPDANAVELIKALRQGDRAIFDKLLGELPAIGNSRGPTGTTPLMQAVLYGDAAMVKALLAGGADPNLRNDAGASALMWAADDLEKTRLLLDHGAEIEARSEDGRTPLQIALSFSGNSDVVKLLLERSEKPFPKAAGAGGSRLVNYAIASGDLAFLEGLIERGAKIDSSEALAVALWADESDCRKQVLSRATSEAAGKAAASRVPPQQDGTLIAFLMDRGGDPNTADAKGRSLLMLAANSDVLPVDSIAALLKKGANVNARSLEGRTALDYAKLRGEGEIVDLLRKAGAIEGVPFKPAEVPRASGRGIREALEKSVPLLQRTDAIFVQRSGCVSCHHNSLASMTLDAARAKQFPFDAQSEADQLKRVAAYLDLWRDRALQGIGILGGPDTVSYLLLGLAAGKHPPDEATDAMARYLKNQQRPDGRWRVRAHRPPMESSDIQVTAASLRALQIYAPGTQRTGYRAVVQRAAEWLEKAQPLTLEDHAFHLLGLSWSGLKPENEKVRKATEALIARQREDGGWAQINPMTSDAYGTGLALVALSDGGGLSASSARFKKGIEFLLKDQAVDGSWYVQSRAVPFQPFFESGFPYGHDQWISAAASNWAAMALLRSLD